MSRERHKIAPVRSIVGLCQMAFQPAVRVRLPEKSAMQYTQVMLRDINEPLTVCKKLTWPHSSGPRVGPYVALNASGCMRFTWRTCSTLLMGPKQLSQACELAMRPVTAAASVVYCLMLGSGQHTKASHKEVETVVKKEKEEKKGEREHGSQADKNLFTLSSLAYRSSGSSESRSISERRCGVQYAHWKWRRLL